MNQTYLVTAINPDNSSVISVWVKASNIITAYEKALPLLREEYKITGYLSTVLSVTLMNND